MTETTPPRENLYRALLNGATSEDGKTLTVRLAPHDQWAEIDSVVEGHFLERFARSAYRKTMAEHVPKILFQHGKDPEIGEKPIATTDEVGEDSISPYARGQLLDGLPPLVADGLRKGVYGASHRFSVVREDWDPRPKGGPHNPDRLPERTITEARLYELGPVTWPAYAGAGVALRSLTDDFTPPSTEPEAPSPVDAGEQPEAAPHLDEPERRDEPVPPPVATQETKVQDEYPTREEKVARVNELRASMKALDEASTGEFEPAVQARWDAEKLEIEKLERDIRAIDERRATLLRLADRDPEPPSAPNFIRTIPEADIYDIDLLRRASRSPEEYRGKVRDNALRAVEITKFPNARVDHKDAAGRIAEFIEYRDGTIGDGPDGSLAERMLTIGSPAYRHAFEAYLRSGGHERGTALAVGVDGTGGYAVPVAFDPTVIAIGAWTAINPYRSVCRQVTITGTDTWQALTSTAVTAAYALEAAAADEQGPTFARPEFIAKRAHAFVTASYEMAADRADLASELSVLFGEARDTLEENQFTVGVGTTVYPQGAGLKDAYTRVDSVTNDTVAVADIRAVEAALPIRHRMNAVWFLSRAAIRAIQAFETTGGQLFNGTNYAAVGNPLNRMGGNTGLTLLGYPVYENPSMPWTPTTDDTTYGLLFNPQSYVIVDRVGMSVRVIPDMLNGATPSFPTGQIGIYAFWRNTARVLNADAGRQGAVQ